MHRTTACRATAGTTIRRTRATRSTGASTGSTRTLEDRTARRNVGSLRRRRVRRAWAGLWHDDATLRLFRSCGHRRCCFGSRRRSGRGRRCSRCCGSGCRNWRTRNHDALWRRRAASNGWTLSCGLSRTYHHTLRRTRGNSRTVFRRGMHNDRSLTCLRNDRATRSLRRGRFSTWLCNLQRRHHRARDGRTGRCCRRSRGRRWRNGNDWTNDNRLLNHWGCCHFHCRCRCGDYRSRSRCRSGRSWLGWRYHSNNWLLRRCRHDCGLCRSWRLSSLLLGLTAFRQHSLDVAGLTRARQINLFRLSGGCRTCRCAATGQVPANLVRFVILDGTRVGLLFCDSDCCKRVKNFFALDLKLTRQIVDAYFAHPPSSYSVALC